MIKTTIDVTTLEGVAVEYYNKALKLAEELQAVGYDNLEILKGEDSWCSYNLFLTVDGATFMVSRNYKKAVSLSLSPYRYYSNVSSSKRSEIYKNTFISNNINVITKKKLDNAIKEELQYHECMATLNDESLDKIQHFLSKIKALESEYTVNYNWNYGDFKSSETHEREKTNISGGYITKHGIQYYFSIDYSSGYITEKLALDLISDNKIEDFKNLANNNYR